MDKWIELLRQIGYPATSVALLLIGAYFFREFFRNYLATVVNRDLEEVRRRNAEQLQNDLEALRRRNSEQLQRDLEDIRRKNGEQMEAVKKDYALAIEDRKSDLAATTERLRTSLSVEAEVYRLAGAKRVEVLMALWQSSEALLAATDFSDKESIKSSLAILDSAAAQVRKNSILLPRGIEQLMFSYLDRIATVLTNSEKNFQNNQIKPEQVFEAAGSLSALTARLIPSISGEALAVGLVAQIGAKLVPSITKILEETRRTVAMKARSDLEGALRMEFGIFLAERRQLGPSITKTASEIPDAGDMA